MQLRLRLRSVALAITVWSSLVSSMEGLPPLREPLEGSIRWRLGRVSKDELTLEVDVTSIVGPGIRSPGPTAEVTETAQTVRVRVHERLEFPGPDGTYSPAPMTLHVRLDEPLGQRRLIADPVDPEMEWLSPPA